MRTELSLISRVRHRAKHYRTVGYEPLEERALMTVTSFPGGVTVNDTQIITEADTIPRFAASPTATSIKSGDWSDPTVWSSGAVPGTGDRVVIAQGTSLSYSSVSTAPIDALEIDGSLSFSTTSNTQLTVGTLTVMPTGTLTIGTAAQPVGASVTAQLVIANQAINTTQDPEQFGTGLIALGTVTMHGAGVNQTWLQLAAEPRAGNTSLLVGGDISDWQPGDTLVLPDTRQVVSSAGQDFDAGSVALQDETVTIDHVQGNRVYLTTAVKYDHLGAYNAAGGLELLPQVALLDRNVVVRSESATGTRGYSLFTARAAVDIEYTRFQNLGRTDAMTALDDTTFNASGSVTHVGTNQDGRNAVSLADLMGPVNTTNSGYQFTFQGNTVDGAKRFGVAIDNTSFGLVNDNVIYNAQGSGIATEEGTEIGNVISNNIAIQIVGTHVDGKAGTANDDYGRGGSGFWFRRLGNTVTGNVAADGSYAGFVITGYNDAVQALPNFRGADPDAAGQTTLGAVNPVAPWSNNEAYGMTTYGLWAAFLYGSVNATFEPNTTFSNFRIWNTFRAGVEMYYSNHVTFDGLLVLGSLTAQDRNDVNSMGMDLSTYSNQNLVVQNSRIEAERIGIAAPTSDASMPGEPQPTIVKNTTLKNYVNVLVQPAYDNRPNNGNALELRDDLFTVVTTIPSGPAAANTVSPPANIQMQLKQANGTNPYPEINLTQPSTVKVYNYNQVAGVNFQVFYPEQASSFVVPATPAAALSSLVASTIGAPLANRTNLQNWMGYGIAIAGAVAPSGASRSRSEINGLVAPIRLPQATPSVALVTPWLGAQVADNPPVRVRYNVNGTMPAGAQVWFQVDGGKPFNQLENGGIYHLAVGAHELRVYIGDLNGTLWRGTTTVMRFFTVKSTVSGAVAAPALAAVPQAGSDTSTLRAPAADQTNVAKEQTASPQSATQSTATPLLQAPNSRGAGRSAAFRSPSDLD
jgi:hypothetical protein